MIRVGKYYYKTKTEPITEGFQNVLIHTTQTLSPYIMKDANGVIMENYWQFSKKWNTYYETKQTVSQYDNSIRWEYPGFEFTDELYWNWRRAGFANDKWVRYPNGYSHHSECVGSITDDGRLLNYIEARKEIYFRKYREIAITLPAFKRLQNKLNKGINIQINEVDGPTYAEEYPYNLVVNDSIHITVEALNALINNPKQAFGHGYALAACLLGIERFD